MNTTDKQNLRIKLELLFRQIDSLQKDPVLVRSEKEKFLERLSFISLGLIHSTREEGVIRFDNEGLMETAKVLQDYFNKTIMQIFTRVEGLPVTLALGKKELIIHDMLDQLTEDIYNIYTKSENL